MLIAILCSWNPLAYIWLFKIKEVRRWVLIFSFGWSCFIGLTLLLHYLASGNFFNEEYANVVLLYINIISFMWIGVMMWFLYNRLQEYDQRKDDSDKTDKTIKD